MARVITPPRALMVTIVLVALVAAFVVLSSGASPAKNCVGRTQGTPGLSSSLTPAGSSSLTPAGSSSLTPAGSASLTPAGSASLTPVAGSTSFTTLPPSHDNDAGRSRIPDATPDADNDTSRARVVCSNQ